MYIYITQMLTGCFEASVCPSAHDRCCTCICVITDVTSAQPVIRRAKIRTAPSHVAESRDPTDRLGPVVYFFSSPKPSGLRMARVLVGANPSLRLTRSRRSCAERAWGAGTCRQISAPISPYAISQFRHISNMASMRYAATLNT